MKLKVYVVETDLSPRQKRLLLRAVASLVLVLGGLAVAHAALPEQTWAQNERLTAPDLNANFKALDDRLVAIDAKPVPFELYVGRGRINERKQLERGLPEWNRSPFSGGCQPAGASTVTQSHPYGPPQGGTGIGGLQMNAWNCGFSDKMDGHQAIPLCCKSSP
jgi:hypothetical protein